MAPVAWKDLCVKKNEVGSGLRDLQDSVNDSWVWKEIIQMRDAVKPWRDIPCKSSSMLYSALAGTKPVVLWTRVVWNKFVLPRHSFILWLFVLNKAKTKEKLMNIGLLDQDGCELCRNGVDSRQHLFFECDYMQAGKLDM